MNNLIKLDDLNQKQEILQKKIRLKESQIKIWSLIRFSFTLLFLGVIISQWNRWDLSVQSVSLLFGLLIFLVFIWKHHVLINSFNFLLADKQQIIDTKNRYLREFLKESKQRFGEDISPDIPLNTYVRPLMGQLFLNQTDVYWLNECQLAFHNQISLEKRRKRYQIVQFLQSQKKQIEEIEKQAIKIKKEKKIVYSNEQNSPKRILFISVLTIIWVSLWSLFLYTRTTNSPLVFQITFLYFLILVGLQIFKPTLWVLKHLYQDPYIIPFFQIIQSIWKEEDLKKLSLEKSVKFKKLIQFHNILQEFILMRKNPVVWFLGNIFALDIIILYAIEVLEKKIVYFLDHISEQLKELDLCIGLTRLIIEDSAVSLMNPDSPSSFKLEVQSMLHPALSPFKRVPHSFNMNDEERIMLLTGSNMAGKSTFLKSLGINLVLYQMGAPVFATHFFSSGFKIISAIQIQDSIESSLSLFYAEVKKLSDIDKHIRSKAEPVFFLIDEIFKGTNNDERYIGAYSILTTWAQYPQAFGILSTHDYRLTLLERQISVIKNYHFSDVFESATQQLSFDYMLKRGPAQQTNALHIMKAEGLPILENLDLSKIP